VDWIGQRPSVLGLTNDASDVLEYRPHLRSARSFHCPRANAPPNHELDRLDGKSAGTVLTPERYPTDESLEVTMGRGLLLWLIGIPIPIIILVWLLGGLHG
jgi:hypothetical protein